MFKQVIDKTRPRETRENEYFANASMEEQKMTPSQCGFLPYYYDFRSITFN